MFENALASGKAVRQIGSRRAAGLHGRDRIGPSLIDTVSDTLRRAGAEAVMPHYRRLASGEIDEKSPGEVVTVADRRAEALIERGLAGLIPGARFVGEEACARVPALLDRIDEGTVWLVDPLDGTANFAAGTPPFAMMAALLRDGEIVAAWIHDPVGGQMAVAERDGGAWIDGLRIRAGTAAPGGIAARRGIVSRFMLPDAMVEPAAAVAAAVTEAAPSRRCAGHEYPLVATGTLDFALYWRTIPWDHAPGVLLLNEAGGVARRPDGTAYRPGSAGTGMLLAHNPDIAEEIGQLLVRGTRA